MKKTHKKSDHHHTPSRKSPRLSSSSSARSDADANANNEWALSLHVVEQPLTQSHEQDNSSSRRSSRFTTNKYKSPIQLESRQPAMLLSQMTRRSPRFASSAPALTLTDANNNVGSGSKKRGRFEDGGASSERRILKKVKKLGLIDDESLIRRSPRLSGSKIGNSSPQLFALLGSGCGSLSEKRLRSRTVLMRVGYEKSKADKKCLGSRKMKWALVESTGNKDVGSASSELVSALQESASKISIGDLGVIGKCSSSKETELALIEWSEASENRNGDGSESPKSNMLASPKKKSKTVKTPKKRVKTSASIKSDSSVMLDESPDVSEERDMEECDLGATSVKCLRSRKIRFKVVNVEESAEKKSRPIEGRASENESNAENTENVEEEKRVVCIFVGEPIPEEVAQEKWKWRYELKSKKKGKSWKINADEEDEIILNVDCHYAQAKVGNCVLDIGDCVYVKGEGNKIHVGKILEFFKTMEGEDYFRVQWFFRAEDTVLKDAALLHDKRRLFYSTLMNDNMLDCIVSKVNVVRISPVLCLKSNPIQSDTFYYDMEYCVEYSTFRTLVTDTPAENQSFLFNSNHPDEEPITLTPLEVFPNYEAPKPELALLDIYSGCGGMSTGLCVGAKLSSLNLVTKWAVDYNTSACDSLRLNHPETQVRNEAAEDFLELLRQWEQLCKLYVCDLERTLKCDLDEDEGFMTHTDNEVSSGEYEVFCLVDICYGDPGSRGKSGLHFKVRWKGYGPDEDTWEPIEGLSNCQERIQDFVRSGFKLKILPIPGDADVICGGPPCQGISGYNRYRNFDSPLADERNRQIVVFMDIVEFLKPKFVLMENVVDIIKFAKATLGRYALSRLVDMRYQARLGTMASGCYGLPQFRLRVFIWGAHHTETLPQFPLPTHDVVVRYWPPLEFERNIVAYDEGQSRTLEEAVVLRDSISDLPHVANNVTREETSYEKLPETEFQSYIRLSKDKIMGFPPKNSWEEEKTSVLLYDHRPLQLSEHEFSRVCLIPRKKGANFRDLPGVVVGEDNVARRDPTKDPIMLPMGKPVVPDSVFNFEQGKSKKPYARLWWDETVSTILTFPYVHCQQILHPEQDRILTIRECARLQGFPDYYRFCGTVRERYCQIGNAVSVPTARALGYALGMAYKKLIGDEPLMMLPPKFSSRVPLIDDVYL